MTEVLHKRGDVTYKEDEVRIGPDGAVYDHQGRLVKPPEPTEAAGTLVTIPGPGIEEAGAEAERLGVDLHVRPFCVSVEDWERLKKRLRERGITT